MLNLIDQIKNLEKGSINLGDELGKGGEGSVFSVQNDSNFVVKIYHTPTTQDKSEKILAMVRLKNERLLKLSAWPIASYHEKNGKLSGFIMPRLNNCLPLQELYNPAQRLKLFPQADWRFLVHAAINTARAFSIIHEAGHVIGDVNHGNILIAQDATVRFIDTDSFQIYSNNKYWLCDVGVAFYQPPEMQLSSFKDVIRTPNYDNFGLAVLIFHLLFLGRHPFAGRFQGKGEMPLEKAIAEYRFAYSYNQKQTLMLAPHASLKMEGLTPHLQSLFERAFSKEACGPQVGLRPTPNEWITALSDLSTKLQSCLSNGGHYYYKELARCPWCDIEAVGGSIFPFRSTVQHNTKNTSSDNNIQILLQRTIREINQDSLIPSQPQFTFNLLPPSFEAISLKKKLSSQKWYFYFSFVIIFFFSTLLTIFWININPVNLINITCIVGLSNLFLGFMTYKIHKRNVYKKFIVSIEEFRKEQFQLSEKCNSINYNKQLEEIKRRLNELNNYYLNMENNRLKLIDKAKSKIRDERLRLELKNSLIMKANIEGIGQERVKILSAHGIESAFDIEYYRLLYIIGFGNVLSERLLRWRQQRELFINSQPIQLTSQQIADVNLTAKKEGDQLEFELTNTLTKYSKLSSHFEEHNKNIQLESDRLVKKYSQVFADAQFLGLKF